MDGALIIDKPSGISSFDVLRELKKLFSEKKMGYLGTLDPLATGVLVVFLGKATSLISYFSETDKEYVTELELGKTSDTYDVTGNVVNVSDAVFPSEEELKKVINSFMGQQWQIQPAFSAIRREGKRSYELAREGKAVDLGKRQVIFLELELLSYQAPLAKVRVKCSSGTYIRSFVHELGQKLGCGAVMSQLQRTHAGNFLLEKAVALEKVNASNLISISEIISQYISWEGRSQNEMAVLLRKYAS
jgi:tRNA pseudouridine55 synthase